MTAGTSKVGDSPLAPRNPVAVAQKRRLLDELHEDFRAAVTSARGKKLRHAEAAAYARRCGDRKSRAERATALFDGSIYAGKTAVAFGLADGLCEWCGIRIPHRRFESRKRPCPHEPTDVQTFRKLWADEDLDPSTLGR